MNNMMRYRGEAVEVRDRFGRVHRGFIGNGSATINDYSVGV